MLFKMNLKSFESFSTTITYFDLHKSSVLSKNVKITYGIPAHPDETKFTSCYHAHPITRQTKSGPSQELKMLYKIHPRF